MRRMCTWFGVVFCLAAMLSPAWLLAAEPTVSLLWPNGAPGAVGTDDADKPTLTLWEAPEGKRNGAAVVICPGGGYGALAIDHEGKQIAEFLNGLGVTAIMLKYRIAPKYHHPAPMQDVQRAIRTVRAQADRLHIDPKRIGVMGFSAGGHLASTAATHFDDGLASGDDIDKVSCRPDFAILCYPVITFTDPTTHAGSRRNLLGEKPDPELVKFYSNETQITEKTPPTFLFHTSEDTAVPPENSILFYMGLRKAKVPAELHIYERGPHGVGLAKADPELSSWSGRLAGWLKNRGYLNPPKIVVDDPAKITDKDFAFQGEYVGELTDSDGVKHAFGAHVIARGNGKFETVGYLGGLPGDGWDGQSKFPGTGVLKDGGVDIESEHSMSRLADGKLVIRTKIDNRVFGELKKTERKSPTLGAKPPAGALVLFEGKGAEEFQGGKVTTDGLLMQGVTSKKKFQSGTLHLEFRTPYMPSDQGQARGNSGCYVQGRYEIQILDSFGLEGKDNECGGIYSASAPRVNMCLPPLSWQTYDIDYTAGVYDAQGKLTKAPRITVKHNGVVIHNDLELKKITPGGVSADGPEPGSLHLQDHGNPVRFRNIWWVDKK